MQEEKIDYKAAGVDVDLGNECSKLMYEASRITWENRKGKIGEVIIPFDDFSGLRFTNISNLKDVSMGANSDGVGTKMELAERLSTYTGDFSYHKGIAYDLLAMVCDDAVVRGAEPITFNSVIDVNKLNKDLIQNLAIGMIGAAKDARVAVVNGEIAELGDRVGGYGDFHYNWAGTVTWIANKNRLITGDDIQVGDYIVSLKETGFRSNGLSLFRKVMKKYHGDNWHEKKYQGKNLAELALIPSRIYTSAIVDMFGGYDQEPRARVKAVAHITGGGISEKLGRVLKKSGYGADITELFEPSQLMLYCQELGVEDREAYKTWNMGNGMLIVTDQPEKVIDIAKEYSIDAKTVGEIMKEPGIKIKNKGFYSSTSRESTLVYS